MSTESTENTANNDRIRDTDAAVRLPKPRVVIIKDGESIYKPGMKTYLAEPIEDMSEAVDGKDEWIRGSKGTVVGGTICTCNTVCTCNTQTVCTCNTESVCTCNTETVCPCNTHSTCVCNTQTVCTCNPQTICSCNPQKTCGCNNNYGCGYVCTCNPVH